jgi:nucleoside-diphosphate-sugar epimerase
MSQVDPSQGPVAVTGASGFVGSQVVAALLRRGYLVRACVTDQTNAEKTAHLKAMNEPSAATRMELFTANLLDEGSYDAAFSGCSAVLHVGTAMGYGGANNPRQVYDGAVNGTRNVLGSVRRSGSVRRLVYTSSFAAIGHPAQPGYMFTEADWASDNREKDPNWNDASIETNGEVAYAMAKVATERLVYQAAQEDGRFDAVSVCPIVVLGPLLSRAHELVGSWQWFLGRMLAGKPCGRGWQHLWNIVDVRDVGEAQAGIIESGSCKTGDRFQLSATDESGELNVAELQAHLARLFPDYDVGGPPDGYAAVIEKFGRPYDAPRAHCDKAIRELGLKTHTIDDTLLQTGRTMVELGLVKPALKAK